MAIKSIRMFFNVTLAFLIFSIAQNTMAVPITVISNDVASRVYDDSTGYITDSYNGTVIPTTQTLTAVSGNSSSISDINYSGNDTSAVFSVDMTHSIDNTSGVSGGCCDYAQTYDASLWFTADVNTIYEIGGFYNMVGDATLTYSNISLYDFTSGTYLMREYEVSGVTANESFLVDGLGAGDFNNDIFGSLTGDLLAGHDYKFFFSNHIQSWDTNSELFTAATATGNVTLTIGTSASVPEPSILALLSLGLVGIGFTRRKVRS